MTGWLAPGQPDKAELISCYECFWVRHLFYCRRTFSRFLCQDRIKVRGLTHLWDLCLRHKESGGLVSLSKACFIILQSLREVHQFLTPRQLLWILTLSSGKTKWVRSSFQYIYRLLTSREAFDDNLLKSYGIFEMSEPQQTMAFEAAPRSPSAVVLRAAIAAGMSSLWAQRVLFRQRGKTP